MLPTGSMHIRHFVQTDDSVPRLFDAYYTTDADIDAVDAFAAAAELGAAAYAGMQTAMINWLAEDSRYLGLVARLYTGSAVGSYNIVNPAGAVGSLESDTCPDYVAGVITRYADGLGPAKRGRVFIPAVAEINTDTSRLNEDGHTALVGVKDALNANLESALGGGFTMGAGHYDRKNVGVFYVVHWTPQIVVATQRRRRLRPIQ